MKGNYRYVGMLLLLVIALALVGCSGQAVAGASTTQSTPTVEPVKASDSLMAEGKVVPAQSADLSFSTSGVIGEVLVKQGDTVKAGQPLLRLKGSDQLESSIAGAELDLLTAQQAIDDLKNNLDLERANASVAIADAMKELDKAQKKSASKEYKHGDQDQIAVARANYLLTKQDVDDAQTFYNGVKDNGEENLTTAGALSALAAAKQKRDTALANLNYLLAKPNELDVAQMDAQLSQAQAKVEDAQARLARLKDGPDASQMALAGARLKNAQMKLKAAKASLTDLDLVAPIDGTVVTLDAIGGEFVQPGKTVVTLADTANWKVETTDLTELNIARISVGMPAMIHFDALKDYEVVGRVERINLQGENRQGDIVYTIRLNLEKPDARLRWNMTAAVTFLEKK